MDYGLITIAQLNKKRLFIETAKKRKSKSEFRCGFLFEEPGGFKGGSPVSSVVVRRVRQNPSSVSRTKPGRPTTAGAASRRSTAP